MDLETDKIDAARKAAVTQKIDMVKADLKHWEYAFQRMKAWRNFARGLQWPGSVKADLSDADRKYVANVTMRHLKQRTARIYAKNPTFKFRKTPRMNSVLWDGTAQQLMVAKQILDAGLDVDGSMAALIQDAMQSRQTSMLNDKIGRTATLLYQYFFREQVPPAKAMMKKQVMTSLTCGVAYFKQSFQRINELPPDALAAIGDARNRLAAIERLSDKMQKGEIRPDDAEAEQLRALIADLEAQPQIVVREGLALDYPDSTNIIPDKDMTYLPGFVGCGHVTEQYCLTPDQIWDVYRVDVKENYTQYANRTDSQERRGGKLNAATGESQTARVWEIWDRQDGMVYTVCDGYPDWLREPYSPLTYTDRFFPWFVYAPNAIDDADDPFPPSDVELVMCQQMEINRAGESLREHRLAARPGHVTGANLGEDDRNKIGARRAHELVVLKGLGEGEKIADKLQPFPTNNIDMNLYQTGPAFQDILRSVGSQEAALGGTSNATATEAGIAQASMEATADSSVDEFDDLLTDMARAGGQILFQNMSVQKVREIVGKGAEWPTQNLVQISQEILLEAVPGSSGRKNQMQQVQVRERMMPLLFQIPGLKHEWMAKDMLHVLDEGIEYEDAIDMDALPIVAMNGRMQAEANRGQPGQGDNGQGGADNAQRPPAPSSAGPARPGQNGAGPMVSTPPTVGRA